MSMNHEKFEQTMQLVEGRFPSTAEALRAHDKAQREALSVAISDRSDAQEQLVRALSAHDEATAGLARVEAERDEARRKLATLRSYEDDWARIQSEACDANDAAQAQPAKVQAEMPDLRINMTRALDLLEVLTSTNYTDRAFVEAVDEADEMLEQLRGKVVLKGIADQQDAQGAQAEELQREDRYFLVMRKDLALLSPADRELALTLMGELGAIMETWNAPKRECLVIEIDWPEYEPTWAAIQARVEGRAALTTQSAAGEPVAPIGYANPKHLARMAAGEMGSVSVLADLSPDENHTAPVFGAPPAAAHGRIPAAVLAPFLAVVDAYDPAEDGAYVPAQDWTVDGALRLTLGQFRALKSAAAAQGNEAECAIKLGRYLASAAEAYMSAIHDAFDLEETNLHREVVGDSQRMLVGAVCEFRKSAHRAMHAQAHGEVR